MTTFDQLLPELDRGAVQGVWVSGGYKNDWIDEATARRFERLKLLVVQDLFPSPLAERATYVLPGAAYAERDGSYVNQADRLQSARWAIRPPVGVRTEGSLLWELSGRRGCIILGRCWRRSPAKSSIFPPSSARCRRRESICGRICWLTKGNQQPHQAESCVRRRNGKGEKGEDTRWVGSCTANPAP